VIADFSSIEKLEKLVDDSKMFEKWKGTNKYAEEINKAAKKLEYIISKSKNFVNIFKMDSEESGQDIEPNILKAFLNCKLIN
jgi:hypothetical protein